MRGCVVDGTGLPVAGAEVTAGDTPGTTDAQGRFDFVAAARSDALRVTAEKHGHAGAAVTESLPLPELRLVMPRWTSIRGRILTERPDLLRVNALVDGEPAGACDLERDGSFCATFTGAADAQLQVWLRHDATPILQFGPYHLPEGADYTDDRLAAVDLRGRLRTLVIDVQRCDGTPARRASVWLASGAGDEDLGWAWETSTGQLRIPVVRPETELLVHAAGSRALRFRPVGERFTVRLRPAMTVRLEVAAPLPRGASLSFVLARDGFGELDPAADGEPRFRVEVPGTWQAQGTLTIGDQSFDLPGNHPITVRDEDGEQCFPLLLSAGEIQEAMAPPPEEPRGGR